MLHTVLNTMEKTMFGRSVLAGGCVVLGLCIRPIGMIFQLANALALSVGQRRNYFGLVFRTTIHNIKMGYIMIFEYVKYGNVIDYDVIPYEDMVKE